MTEDTTFSSQPMEIFNHHRLFKSLSNDEKHALLSISREESYAPGDFILREGELGESFYLVVEGKLKVLKDVPSQDTKNAECICILEQGDTFGEMAILDREPRSASVCAATECKVRVFENSALQGMIKFIPEAYTVILKNLAHAISDKLRVIDTRFAITLFMEKIDHRQLSDSE